MFIVVVALKGKWGKNSFTLNTEVTVSSIIPESRDDLVSLAYFCIFSASHIACHIVRNE